MCCSRALYTANQIYFGSKNSGWRDLRPFDEAAGGNARSSGACGHSGSHHDPASPFFPSF